MFLSKQDITDLNNGSRPLKAVGVNHGEMLYMLYRCETNVVVPTSCSSQVESAA